MTEQAARSGGSEPTRVLLLMAAGEDRRLLEEWLGRRYDVVTGASAAALEAAFDLCIVDEPNFARHTDALIDRKERAAPAFLPYLLVLGGHSGSDVDARVWEHVDEVVATPIEQAALQGRLTGLLARRELSTALAEREERIRRVLRAIPDPLLVVEDGTVVEVNPAFEDYTGREAGRVVGAAIADVGAFPAETAETLSGLAGGSGADGRSTATVTYRSADGTVRSAEVATAALPATEGGARTLFVLRDVTERLERERALEREADRLDQFADMLAHELRNPLNIAQGYLGQVRPTDEGDEAALDRVSTSHRRMEQMIKELLAHARNDPIDERRTVTLGRIAAVAWKGMPTADASLEVADEGTVEADPEGLQTLLENLFRNAVEHGSTSSQASLDDAVEHGSTSSQASRHDVTEQSSAGDRTGSDNAVAHGSTGDRQPADTADDPPGITVRVGTFEGGFYVEDDGPGIPPGDRERVFERGYTTESAGTGLGLALVREIADAHGWEVIATEGDAGGARFEFVDRRDAEGAPPS